MAADGCLEIGGSHVCVGRVDPSSLTLTDFRRYPIDSAADPTSLITTMAAVIASLPPPPPPRWVIAIPGPFDYAHGIAGRHPAGKFAAWAGLDLGALLAPILGASRLTFVNDAAAFALGHYFAAPATRRLVGLTFGSGIGSAFVDCGRPVADKRVPPGGELYAVDCGDGLSVEARFGPAALAHAAGHPSFQALADAARTDSGQRAWLERQFAGLAAVLSPWLRSFAPEVLACGGRVCGAWDVFGESFVSELTATLPGLIVTVETHSEHAAMRGAVAYAAGRVE